MAAARSPRPARSRAAANPLAWRQAQPGPLMLLKGPEDYAARWVTDQVVKALKELLPTLGMTLVEASAPRSVDVGSAARSLVGKVDAIYTNTDNNVVSAYEALVKVGNDAKIPLIASDTDSVKRGAIAALGFNYKDVGKQTGEIVVRILKGENPGDIAVKVAAGTDLVVNKGAAAKMGVTLPEALVGRATRVIE